MSLDRADSRRSFLAARTGFHAPEAVIQEGTEPACGWADFWWRMAPGIRG